MKSFYLCVICFISFSCDSSNSAQQSHDNELSAADSLIVYGKQNSHVFTSVASRNFSTAEQNKVISDINFGMPKNQVSKRIEVFIKKHRKLDRRLSSGYTFYDYYIGNYKFSDHGFEPEYHNNGLYKFLLPGNYIDWERFDSEVPRQVQALSDVIRQEYGNPIDSMEIPSMHEMQKHYSYTIRTWQVGKKEIKVLVSDYGTMYAVNASIYLPAIVTEINSASAVKERQRTKNEKSTF